MRVYVCRRSLVALIWFTIPPFWWRSASIPPLPIMGLERNVICTVYSVQYSAHNVCAAVEYSIIVGAIRSLKHCIVNDGAVQELRMEWFLWRSSNAASSHPNPLPLGIPKEFDPPFLLTCSVLCSMAHSVMLLMERLNRNWRWNDLIFDQSSSLRNSTCPDGPRTQLPEFLHNKNINCSNHYHICPSSSKSFGEDLLVYKIWSNANDSFVNSVIKTRVVC